MIELNELNEEKLRKIKETYSVIKTLKEEKKSLSEDISEEKKDCAKKTGLQVRDLNSVMKILDAREKGDFSEDSLEVVRALEKLTLKQQETD